MVASRSWLVSAALALLSIGCDAAIDSSHPVGQQRLSGRDFDNLFYWSNQTLGFTRQTLVPGVMSQDFWLWPNGAAAPAVALSEVQWSPPNQVPRSIYGDLMITGASGQIVYDLQSQSSVDLLSSPPPPPSDPSMVGGENILFSVFRSDAGAVLADRQIITGSGAATVYTDTFLVGRPGSFFQSGPWLASGVDFMGSDLAVLGQPQTTPIVPPGLYRLQLPSGQITPLGAPPLDPDLPLPSQRCLANQGVACALFRVVGCQDNVAPCDSTGVPPCVVFYTRAAVSDAGTPVALPYAFDVNAGVELALPGSNPSAFSISPDQHTVAWTHSDDDDVAAGIPSSAATNVYYRDLCSGSGGQCSMARPEGLQWRSDSGALIATLAAPDIGVVSLPGGDCTFPAAANGGAPFVELTPDGQHMAWLSAGAADSKSIWMGDALGAQAQQLVAGPALGFGFTGDVQRMFIWRAPGQEESFDWIALGGAAPVEQTISDNMGGQVDWGNRRVLLVDRWNTQDASGTLALFDLVAGTRLDLAQAVTGFAAYGAIDDTAQVTYLVHGRYASAQDGIWQTTLPPLP
jgi:hypothetical protein